MTSETLDRPIGLVGNPYIDSGLLVASLLIDLNKDVRSLTYNELFNLIDDGVNLACNVLLSKACYTMFPNNFATQTAFRKPGKAAPMLVSLFKTCREGILQDLDHSESALYHCDVCGRKTLFNLGDVIVKIKESFISVSKKNENKSDSPSIESPNPLTVTKKASRKKVVKELSIHKGEIGRNVFPLVGSLGNEASVHPSWNKEMELCPICTLITYFTPTAIVIINGMASLFTSEKPEIWTAAERETIREAISNLQDARNNPNLLATLNDFRSNPKKPIFFGKAGITTMGQGSGFVPLLEKIKEVFNRNPNLTSFAQFGSLILWQFSNSGQDANFRALTIPNEVMQFLYILHHENVLGCWDDISAAIALETKKNPLKKPYFKFPPNYFFNIIETRKEYPALYIQKYNKLDQGKLAYGGVKVATYVLYQTMINKIPFSVLDMARALAKEIELRLITSETKLEKQLQWTAGGFNHPLSSIALNYIFKLYRDLIQSPNLVQQKTFTIENWIGLTIERFYPLYYFLQRIFNKKKWHLNSVGQDHGLSKTNPTFGETDDDDFEQIKEYLSRFPIIEGVTFSKEVRDLFDFYSKTIYDFFNFYNLPENKQNKHIQALIERGTSYLKIYLPRIASKYPGFIWRNWDSFVSFDKDTLPSTLIRVLVLSWLQWTKLNFHESSDGLASSSNTPGSLKDPINTQELVETGGIHPNLFASLLLIYMKWHLLYEKRKEKWFLFFLWSRDYFPSLKQWNDRLLNCFKEIKQVVRKEGIMVQENLLEDIPNALQMEKFIEDPEEIPQLMLQINNDADFLFRCRLFLMNVYRLSIKHQIFN